ncbi:calcium/sodium antiporter [Candidatus Aerophobetes bacterium]|uniref:Calcium/sodium antiporter n=1 Tax=Aerophobetes bacterium TaxID=2030807 RepID=A0A523UNG1_UNCAE|nr:MAG: calcium/sodium antiporter [Candidatus Aerophobetes bacterium]
MGVISAAIIFAGAFVILLKSADFFVDGAVGIADTFGIPKIVVGIVLVSLATSLPEFSVSVQAAYLGHPEIALGNVVGSVMANAGLALAVTAIIGVCIAVDRHILKSFGIFLIISAFISYAFAFDAFIGRIEGILLLFLLAGYYYYLVRRETSKCRQEVIKEGSSDPKLRRILFFFIIGIVGVIISSRLIIWSGLWIAKILGVPEIIIGLTVIAIGTSLPEISTAIASALKGHGEIAIGNILGANILNILWIIGAAATVRPIRVNPRTIAFAYPWMLLVVVAMVLLMRHRHQLTRKKGVLLMGLYGIYFYQVVRWIQG